MWYFTFRPTEFVWLSCECWHPSKTKCYLNAQIIIENFTGFKWVVFCEQEAHLPSCFYTGDLTGQVLAYMSLIPIAILVGFVTLIVFKRELHTVSSFPKVSLWFNLLILRIAVLCIAYLCCQ